MMDFLETLRTKPEHIRQRVALGTAVVLTGLVTIGWGAAFVSSDALALAPIQTTVPGPADVHQAVAETRSTFSSLLGAVGGASATSSSPTLTIIDTDSSSTIDAGGSSGGDQTVIPF